jgi:hypothetical protein
MTPEDAAVSYLERRLRWAKQAADRMDTDPWARRYEIDVRYLLDQLARQRNDQGEDRGEGDDGLQGEG